MHPASLPHTSVKLMLFCCILLADLDGRCIVSAVILCIIFLGSGRTVLAGISFSFCFLETDLIEDMLFD